MASICPLRKAATAPAADADDCDFGRLEPLASDQVVHHHMGAGTWRRHPDLQALEIARRAVIGRLGGCDANGNLRRLPLQHESGEDLFLGLQVDHMLIGARHHVGAAAHHRLECGRATGKVADLDHKPFFAKVAQLFGDGERQVVERCLAAHGDMDILLLGRLGMRSRHECDLREHGLGNNHQQGLDQARQNAADPTSTLQPSIHDDSSLALAG